MLWSAFQADVTFSFQKHKRMAEEAIAQLSDDAFFRQPAATSNSVALIVKHVGSNLRSRWTDVLTTDGDKPWRDRDDEFIIGPGDTRARLLGIWNDGFTALFHALAELQEEDAGRTIAIRGEPHTVLQAVTRSLTHTTYHVGQLLYVARLVADGPWQWLTIPPGGSNESRRKYLS